MNITGSYNSSSIQFNIQTEFYEDRVKFWRNANIAENFKMNFGTSTTDAASTTNTRARRTTASITNSRATASITNSRSTASCSTPDDNFIKSNL